MSTVPSPSSPVRQIVVVLGMHRSGTSAVTGALVQLGFPVGGAALPAADDNPLGYFENAEAVDINEALLLDLGRGWDDLRPLPDDWLRSDASDAARARIEAWLEALVPDHGRVVLKDPRLCLLFPLWREAFEARQLDVRVVLAHRSLSEVAASLVRRDAMAEPHALLLTLRHVLEAERATRGMVRAVCHYDALLADPERSLLRLLADLGIDRPDEPTFAAALAGFDPVQRHHRIASKPSLPGLDDLCESIAMASTRPGGVLAFPDDAVDRVTRACLDAAPVLQPRADALRAARALARRFAHAASRLDAGLGEARSLALERLGEVERLDERLKQVDDALAACERERQQVTAALAEASALAHARLDEIGALTTFLAEARDAMGRAEAMAVDRLRAIEGLEAELRHVREGLERAESLAVERLAALGAMDAALAETRQALSRTETLAIERMSQIGTLVVERDGLEQRKVALEAEVADLRASWAWRITAPLRWVAGRLGMRVP